MLCNQIYLDGYEKAQEFLRDELGVFYSINTLRKYGCKG